MRVLVRSVSLAVILAGAGASAVSADVTPQRKWQQVQSPHFRVMGDAGDRTLRQVAERMEQLHALLGMLAPETEVRTPDTTVIVFRDQRAYAPFQPIYNGTNQLVGGYFLGGPMNYITLLAGTESESHSVVYHEYVHLVLNRLLGTVAPWIDEGLAEFYSTFAVTDGGRTAQLGGLLQRHLWQVQASMLPLAALAAVDHDSPFYNERDKTSVFYAQSWALVHYLQLGKERKYAPKFGPLLTAITGGMPFAAACTSILGVTPEVLQEELRKYAFSPVLYRASVPLPTRITAIERLVPTPVSDAEAHATLGDLLSRLDGRTAAREHLEHALNLDPAQPLAVAALAALEARAHHTDRAGELARRPSGAPTYLTEYYRAEALEAVDIATHAEAIEAALRRAIALHNEFSPGLASLARHLANGGTDAGKAEALTLIARAIALAPTREDYVLYRARIHLLMGDTQLARNTLGPLVGRGSTAEIKRAARELLSYAANVELEAAARRERPERTNADLPPLSEPPAVELVDPGSASGLGSDPPPSVVLDLRTTATGEVRAPGTITVIDCSPGSIVVTITGNAGVLRLRSTALDQIDFISYRDDRRGAVRCGGQAPVPVLVTYRPSGEATTSGVVVAIEFVPDGYRPPRGQ